MHIWILPSPKCRTNSWQALKDTFHFPLKMDTEATSSCSGIGPCECYGQVFLGVVIHWNLEVGMYEVEFGENSSSSEYGE